MHGKRRDWWTDGFNTLAYAAMHAGQKGVQRIMPQWAIRPFLLVLQGSEAKIMHRGIRDSLFSFIKGLRVGGYEIKTNDHFLFNKIDEDLKRKFCPLSSWQYTRLDSFFLLNNTRI